MDTVHFLQTLQKVIRLGHLNMFTENLSRIRQLSFVSMQARLAESGDLKEILEAAGAL